MIIDINILHYKEDMGQVLESLNSVNNQENFDFSTLRVNILHDVGATPLKLLEDDFNFKIYEYSMLEKRTIGEMRQYLTDKTSGDYIIWLDADDLFVNMKYLSCVYKELSEHPEIEILITPYFREEMTKNRYFEYYLIDGNSVQMMMDLHGKIYQREFLKTHNITFQGLNLGEDTSFNYQCLPFCIYSKIVDRSLSSYLYRFNENSSMRHEKHSYSWIFVNTMNSYDSFLDKITDNSCSNKSIITDSLVTPFLLIQYYFLLVHKSDDLEVDDTLARSFFKRWAPYVKKEIINDYPNIEAAISSYTDTDFLKFIEAL